jgi:hypothetical protein
MFISVPRGRMAKTVKLEGEENKREREREREKNTVPLAEPVWVILYFLPTQEPKSLPKLPGAHI